MKVLYVTTISNTINAFLVPHIKSLLDNGHQVDVACNLEREIDPYLIERNCKIINLEFQRNPLDKRNYKAYKELQKVIIEEGYDLVHTHTPVVSALVRLACKKIKSIKVIYTAHGFHFFKGAPLLNWMVYYPIELVLSKYTDVLITINKEDYLRAKLNFKAKKVVHVPGVGININKFTRAELEKEKELKKMGFPNNKLLLLSVGELNSNKNHEVVLKALKMLNNPDIYYVICGEGNLKDYLVTVIEELGLKEQVYLMGYRKDIPNICLISDMFIFPSKREGLGLAALEAMAAGLPIITSNIHGIVDYSVDNVTGYSTSPNDVEGFANAIRRLASNSKIRHEMGLNNKESVKTYSLENVLFEMETIYKDVLDEERR